MPTVRPDRFNLIPDREFSSLRSAVLAETLFRVDDEAAPYMAWLAKEFPKEFPRALRHAAYLLQQDLRRTLRQESSAPGTSWPELSRMHVFRRMDLLKAGYADADTGKWTHGQRFSLKQRYGGVGYAGRRKVKGKGRGSRLAAMRASGASRQSIPDAFNRWKGRGITRSRNPMGGRLQNAMRYKYYDDTMRVQIGALSRSASGFLVAVQAGRRGTRGVFQFEGNQPITPTMRRAFWAAGVPLAKSTHALEQPQRPLVGNVYRKWQPQIPGIIEQRVADIVAGRTGRRR
ncbi:hypothetical protein [Nitratidesulfovibrio liaohensis]|uniref:Uncharacterized protein n=1 Tax=Nitratidesulfovibrio liaohensis TaxID=2604158 RepID=A0ABY9QZA2_9BACT|nr:hypothetical protein [Nitratidesulfovibrio liaohensis]WMW64396.1 hypothetical protein KPS_002408 [Nitratidesulfovibrio liaohensis]